MIKLLWGSLSTAALSAALSSAHAQADHSADVIEFGLDDTLFVADSSAGYVFAYDLPDDGLAPAEDAGYNILDVDAAVEGALGADPRSLSYTDLAVHPVTRTAYASVIFTHEGEERSAVVALNRDSSVHRVALEALQPSSYALQDPADQGVSFWRDIPAPTLTVTDLDYVDGELFVSGLSTGEFASTLRRVPFPFDGTEATTSVEIFHAVHAQNETRAPIRAMSVVNLDGTPTVVAAYTCTPLVTLPVSNLENGAHVVGTTIAELGYGNTPLDVIAFSAADRTGASSSYVLVVNREMDADLITFDALTDAAAGPGLVEPIPYMGATAGVETSPRPLSGVLHAADQDDTYLVALRRNLESGRMELVSFRKDAMFRLSDFISEYNFPDYVYAEDQFSQGTRMFQNAMKVSEDFADQQQ